MHYLKWEECLSQFMVIEDPLDFNMLLGCDYVYAMKVVMYTLFRVMHFPHNESIITINQLSFIDPPPHSIIDQVFPLLIPSVSIDTTPTQVNYLAPYTLCPISTKKKPLDS